MSQLSSHMSRFRSRCQCVCACVCLWACVRACLCVYQRDPSVPAQVLSGGFSTNITSIVARTRTRTLFMNKPSHQPEPGNQT